MDLLRITFLLVNFNMKGLIGKCLASIYQQGLDPKAYEILIADNSNDPNFAIDQEFISSHPNVTLYKLVENKGWVNALNHLLSKPRGEIVFIMHPDVEFRPGCINQLTDYLDRNTDVGIVSPDIVYPNGVPTKIRLKFPSICSESKRILNILAHIVSKKHLVTDEILWDRKNDTEADMAMSICLVIRNNLLQIIGQIPDSIKIYYSNDFLSWKTKKLGKKVFYLKDAVCVHYERFSNDKLYSRADDTAYKKTAIPIIDKMEKDKYSFLRFVYPFVYLIIMRLVNTLEYLIHILASFKNYKSFANEASRMYSRTIRSIWGTW